MDTLAKPQDRPGVTSWQAATTALAICLGGLLIAFWDTAGSMEATWRRSDTFQHGYLILPIVFYLVWEKWPSLSAMLPSPTAWGLPVVMGAAFLWLLGNVAHVQLVQQAALVGMVQGLVLTTFGLRLTRALIFPLGYLFFLVPAGEFFVPILQDLTANFAVAAVALLDYRVYSDGLMIYVAAVDDLYTFVVAKECSGIRYQIAMLAVGLLVAHLFFRSLTRRVLCVIAALAVPIVANWVRATGIIWLVVSTQGRHGTDIDHIIYGFWFFAFLMIIFILICRQFAEDFEMGGADMAAARPMPASNKFLQMSLGLPLAGLALAFLVPFYAAYVDGAAGKDGATSLAAPTVSASWHVQLQREDWKPVFTGLSQDYLGRYEKGGAEVDLYLGLYRNQVEGAELISWANTFESGDWRAAGAKGTAKMELSNGTVRAAYMRLMLHERQRLVVYWYWVDGKLTSDPRSAKLYTALSKLFNRNHAAAVIAVSTDYAGDVDVALERIQQFILAARPMGALPHADSR